MQIRPKEPILFAFAGYRHVYLEGLTEASIFVHITINEIFGKVSGIIEYSNSMTSKKWLVSLTENTFDKVFFCGCLWGAQQAQTAFQGCPCPPLCRAGLISSSQRFSLGLIELRRVSYFQAIILWKWWRPLKSEFYYNSKNDPIFYSRKCVSELWSMAYANPVKIPARSRQGEFEWNNCKLKIKKKCEWI